ncbi:hypothetical protein [Variovorax sp. KBW07]|uniref:hypothetical protein n=1 Tax=Variovorax sp. KBW07 TaxID=2153358 RepID=UPI000F5633C1|nr:hypothetical protein [Variovorax sp. KBW07]
MNALAGRKEMSQKSATSLGLLAASVLPTAYLAIVFPLSGDRDLGSIAGTFLVAYFFAAAATAVLGIPMFFVLNKLKLVRWWSATVSGILVGAITLLAVRVGGSIDFSTLLRFALLGGGAGLLFWIVWRMGLG